MAAPQYTYPTVQELRMLDQEKTPKLTQDDLIFQYFPIVEQPVIDVRFTQRDNYTGLQGFRGVGGQPTRVRRVGAKSYLYEPGVYGEFITLEEKEIIERAAWANPNQYMSLDAMVTEAQDQLIQRRVDRIKWIMWTLLATGIFFVPTQQAEAQNTGTGVQGGAGHGDMYANVTAIGQFGIQTFTASPTWATLATATPMADLRNFQLTAERGRSVSFGRGTVAIMNRATFLNVVNNQNANDLGGQVRDPGGSKMISLDNVNEVLIAQDLPTIIVYDEGYIDDNNTFQLWVPNNVVILIGARANGEPVGQYWLTRNANNDGMAPGVYQFVNDSGLVPNQKIVPRQIDVHDGHNGGPVLFYPSAIGRMTV
jgi:hypothetical protein